MEMPDDLEFAGLVKLNMKRAYYSALGFLGSHDEAMEASQAAFVKAYDNFHKFDRSRNFFTWYYTILKNLCLNMIRQKAKHTELEVLDYDTSHSVDDAQDDFDKQELKNNLQKAMFELNAEDRGILILKEFEGFSYKEIASVMDIPVGTVMSRLYYARKKLYQTMEGRL